jgi:hypothetical protein
LDVELEQHLDYKLVQKMAGELAWQMENCLVALWAMMWVRGLGYVLAEQLEVELVLELGVKLAQQMAAV